MEVSRLTAFPLFQGLGEDELAPIAAAASVVDAAEGDALATEGDFGYALYAIESGTADVSADGEHLRALGPGDVFGEIAIISSGRRTATVTATSPMRLIALFKRDVWALEARSPEIVGRLRAAIAAHRA